MNDIFKSFFGNNNPFKNSPTVNMFFMSAPEKKKVKDDDEDSTLKQILKSSKNIEAGQSQVSHVGGD